MGIAERKEREKQELKDKIINAATEIFLEAGADGTSIRMIADRIEYSPATIYLHFKDKNELFNVIMDRAFSLFFQYFSTVLDISEPMERLKALGHVYLKFALENSEFYSLMFIIKEPMAIHRKEENWDLGKRSHDILTQTVQDCINAGYFKGHQSEILSFSIWSTVHGLVSLKICDRMVMYSQIEAEELLTKALESFNEMLERA